MHNMPFLVDGDFSMNESAAIATYLVRKFKVEKTYCFPFLQPRKGNNFTSCRVRILCCTQQISN